MKLLLVKPPHPRGGAVFLMPPIGLLFVAAEVLRGGAAEVEICDLTLAARPADELAGRLRRFAPDVVGFGAFSRDLETVCRYCDLVGRTLPDARTVVGGPIAETAAPALLEHADFVIRGEGERSCLALLRALAAGSIEGARVPGLITRRGGTLTESPVAPVEDPDELPQPAWHLVDLAVYDRHHSLVRYRKKDRVAPLFTSRGCPFRCAYCHGIFGKRFRPHSAERVLRDLRQLYALGVREFQIVDDSFNFDRQRALDIFAAVEASEMRGIAFAFPNGLEPSRLDAELVAAMKRCGTYYVSLAFEAASDRIRRMIRKTQRLGDVIEAARLLDAARIFCNGFFMVGFPSETRAEIEQTLSLVLDPHLHTADVFSLVVYPGTELAGMTRELPTRGPELDYFSTTTSHSEHVPARDLQRMKARTLRRFYGDPRRVYRILRDLPPDKGRPRVLADLALLFLWRMATGRHVGISGHV